MLNGQLSGILLLLWVIGFLLLRSDRRLAAGVLLSLLALKPQFLVGAACWLLLRRDGRALLGLLLGLAGQLALVRMLLGEAVIVAYVDNLRIYGELGRIYQFTADYEHALAGILTNVMGPDFAGWAKLVHFLVAGYAGWLLWRIVQMTRSQSIGTCPVEASAAVLFSLLLTPHLLVYDLSLLLLPIALLCTVPSVNATTVSTDAEPVGQRSTTTLALGLALYGSAMAAPLYLLTGFSVVPLVLLATMQWCAHEHT